MEPPFPIEPDPRPRKRPRIQHKAGVPPALHHTLTVRLALAEYEWLVALARREHRSLSAQARHHINEARRAAQGVSIGGKR